MKKIKKLVTLAAAASILMSSSISVSAITTVNGTRIVCPIESYYFTSSEAKNGDPIPAGTYSSSTNPNITYKVELDGGTVSYTNARVAGSPNAHAFRIYGNGIAKDSSEAHAARISIKIGNMTEDKRYVVSFDGYRRDNPDDDDYATFNMEGWNGGARLSHNTKWTVNQLAEASSASGYTWNHYEAEFYSELAPELEFSVDGWGHLYIDNIVVKDSSNNVIFSEDFEDPTAPVATATPTATPTPTAVPASGAFDGYTNETTIVDGGSAIDISYGNTNGAICRIETNGSGYAWIRDGGWATSGTRGLFLDGGSGSDSAYALARFQFNVPAPEGEYYLSFNAIDGLAQNYQDYATLNLHEINGSAKRMSGNLWTKSDATPSVGTHNWKHYTATITADGNTPEFRFAAYGSGRWHLDDIKVEDKFGNVLFYEDFEKHDYDAFYPTLTQGGSKISELSAGTVNVASTVQNKKVASPMDMTLYAVVFDSTGRFKNEVHQTESISTNTKQDFSVDIAVAAGDELRVFWWQDDVTSKRDLAVFK